VLIRVRNSARWRRPQGPNGLVAEEHRGPVSAFPGPGSPGASSSSLHAARRTAHRVWRSRARSASRGGAGAKMNTCAFGTGIAGVRARLFGITALPTSPPEPPFAPRGGAKAEKRTQSLSAIASTCRRPKPAPGAMTSGAARPPVPPRRRATAAPAFLKLQPTRDLIHSHRRHIKRCGPVPFPHSAPVTSG